MSNILTNPFHLLGASTRSTKAEIAELAEDAALTHDHALVVSARGELANTRTRLSAELGWLPGASPRKASEVIGFLRDPMNLIGSDLGLSAIAAANAVSTALCKLIKAEREVVKVGCDDLAQYFESIDLNEVLRDINEDRSVAGFPLLNDLDPLEDELAKLRRAYVQSMVQALDRLPSSELVEVVTELVEEATSYGVEPASALIGDLVEVYERRVGGFLESEAEDIEKLIDATKARAEEGAEAGEIDALTTRILERAQHWDEKAQPVQVLMESRGLEHRVSVRLALALRGLAIELFNEHDYLNISKRISDRLREIFAEVPEIAERVEQDIEALVEIADARRNEAVRSKKEQEEFAASIAYEATFGLLIKDTFRLSTNGVSWKGSSLSLEEVDGISWGGLRGDYKTTFDVRIYSPRGTLFVEFSDESKFGPMIERLWKAVGVRLLIELLQTLRSGAVMTFGGMRISDRGVVIPVERMFRATQEVFVPWGEARKSSQGGQLVLTSGDGKAKGSIDLRQSKNSPVLSTALDIYWKKGGSTLSSILGK